MEIKWFFVIWGFVFTILIAGSIYFIASNISTQSFIQYQQAQIQADKRLNQSTTNHNEQTNNITSVINNLNDRLEPILDQIPNATQSKIDQDRHYNQTAVEFNMIHELKDILNVYSNGTERIDREEQDHERLIVMDEKLDIMGKSLGSLLKALNSSSGTIIEVPIPVQTK